MYDTDRNVIGCNDFEKQQFLVNLSINSSHPFVFNQEKGKYMPMRKTCTSLFIAAFFIRVKQKRKRKKE